MSTKALIRRASVLDCASPLALLKGHAMPLVSFSSHEKAVEDHRSPRRFATSNTGIMVCATRTFLDYVKLLQQHDVLK